MAPRASRAPDSADASFDPPPGRGTADETQLVADFERRVRHVARQRVSEECVDDIVQQTLAAVLTALREGRIHDPEKLPGFVYGTARNVISNWVRDEKRWEKGRSRTPDRPETRDAHQLLLEKERARKVAACLETLHSRDRRILELCFYRGLTPRELAEELGIEPKAARQRKWRALKRFEKAWVGRRS